MQSNWEFIKLTDSITLFNVSSDYSVNYLISKGDLHTKSEFFVVLEFEQDQEALVTLFNFLIFTYL
jgi:hypothetical protein